MLDPILGLLFKSPCALCRRPAPREICGDCQRQIQDYRRGDPGRFWRGEFPRFVWGRYEGSLKRAIAVVKYDRHPALGQVMGRWLARSWCASPPVTGRRYTVIPVPLHPTRERERGFNQAEAIARGFCHLAGYPLRPSGLIRVRDTAALFGLGREERGQVLRSAFRVGERLPGEVPILLLDDIHTTGTTVREAARTLRSGGYRVAGAIVLSSPPP